MSPATPTADDAAEAEFMMSSLLLKSVSATRRTPVDLPLALSELTYKKREQFIDGQAGFVHLNSLYREGVTSWGRGSSHRFRTFSLQVVVYLFMGKEI